MESFEQNTQSQADMPVQYDRHSIEPKCKWNWFAFLNPILFAFGTKAWLCLLYFIPFISFVWCFVSGACAERWAWDSGFYDDEKSFRKAMQTWNRAGVFMAIVSLIMIVAIVIISILFAGTLLTRLNDELHVVLN